MIFKLGSQKFSIFITIQYFDFLIFINTDQYKRLF